ncbi:MAG: ribose-phosphate diphosphokinase [Burkholderiales bacterium]
MSTDKLCLFALNASRKFGASVARHLGVALSEHEETDFSDGEHKARPLHDTRGKDVFVVQSLHADSHQSIGDKLCRLLFFLGAIKDASPARLTAVIPYLCYARQDSRSHPQDPVTTRYVARMLEAAGAGQVMTMEVHNLAAFQNAFRCRTDHLDSGPLFAHYFETLRETPAITNTAPPWRLDPARVRDDITVLDATHLFASAIARIHGEE